jgi:hypothetical protein
MTPAVQPRAALLWDVRADAIDPATHRDFLVGRVLGFGTVDDIRALRRDLGDGALCGYLSRTRARRLDRRRVRYLEAILGLDATCVAVWLADPGRGVWDAR